MDFLMRYRNYLWSGLFAAGGTFFAKLPTVLIKLRGKHVKNTAFSTSKEIANYDYIGEFIIHSTNNIYLLFVHCWDFVDYMCQIIPLILMIICNILNWRLFLKALQTTNHTVTATVLTAACNYLFTVHCNNLC